MFETFLEEHEWRVLLRYPPVRYIRDNLKYFPRHVCATCGKVEEVSKLQLAHIIPFRAGIFTLGLRPEFLTAPANLTLTHKGSCNKAQEVDLNGALRILHDRFHVTGLPSYLGKEVVRIWFSVISA